jgi:hypothetical protein
MSQFTATDSKSMVGFKPSLRFQASQAFIKAINNLDEHRASFKNIYLKRRKHFFLRKNKNVLTRLTYYHQITGDFLVKSLDTDVLFRSIPYAFQYYFSKNIYKLSNSIISIDYNQQSLTVIHDLLIKREKLVCDQYNNF